MVNDEDVRLLIDRVQSGQAEEEEIVAFLFKLIPPKPIKVRKAKDK